MILIIGWGSRLHGDDAIGQIMAERLAHLPGVTAVCCTQLTPELAEPLSRARTAYFIDAVIDLPPAHMVCLPIAAAAEDGGVSTHHIDPASLLSMARGLYGAAPPCWLIGVGGASFAYSTTLSPSLAAALPALIERASGWIMGERSCTNLPL